MARILLLHDDAVLRSQYRKLFERAGHTVSEASADAAPQVATLAVPFDRIVTELPTLPDDTQLFPIATFEGELPCRAFC